MAVYRLACMGRSEWLVLYPKSVVSMLGVTVNSKKVQSYVQTYT